MPHVDYAAMRAALTTSTAWTGYLHFDHRRLGTKAFGIAVRRDSKHFGRIVALLRPPRRH
jgi:hypothetical protein